MAHKGGMGWGRLGQVMGGGVALLLLLLLLLLFWGWRGVNGRARGAKVWYICRNTRYEAQKTIGVYTPFNLFLPIAPLLRQDRTPTFFSRQL